MLCPWCLENDNQEQELILIEPGGNLSHYWACLACGGKVFPGRTQVSEAEELWRSEQAYYRMMAAKKGGGSKKAGRKREGAKKKASNYWQEV